MYPRKIISLRASFDKWWSNFCDINSGQSLLTDKGKCWLAVQALAETTHRWVEQRREDLGQVHVDAEVIELATLVEPIFEPSHQINPEEARMEFELWYRDHRKFEPTSEHHLTMDQLLIRKDNGYLYGHPNGLYQAYKQALTKHNLIKVEKSA